MKNVHSGIRFFKAALLSIVCLFVFLCLSGCPTEASSDKSISKITIYNIPAQITVNGSDAAPNNTFKVYLNASDYQVDDKPPAAKGVAFISSGVKDPVSGTYSVQIELQKPLPADEHDPNFVTDPWSGTSNYFSVMISPVDPKSVGVNAVWVKGGFTLNKGKALCDWDSLMDFRDPNLLGGTLAPKAQSLYDQIILCDPDLGLDY